MKSNVQVSAFRWVPPFAQGLVRDLRVRWALEEAGRSYDATLIAQDDQTSSDYRRKQPFGQVPILEDDGLVLFESGAIVLHIAAQSSALMPTDAVTRSLVTTWMFAALNTIEPPVMMLNVIDMRPGEKDQSILDLRGSVHQMINLRLDNLADYLGDRHYLVGDRFTAADLLMTTVLRILRTTALLENKPRLLAYRERNEYRPAFQKALAAQMKPFAEHAPPGKA